MKKIAVLYSGGRQWGGIETYLANLFRLHDQERLSLLLISMGEWDLTQALEKEGLSRVVRLISPKRVRLRTVLDIRRIVRDEHIELIVSQGTVANAYARAAAFVSRVPSLVVVHSDMRLDYPVTNRWAFTLSDRLLRRVTKRYITVSRDLKTKLAKTGVAEERATVIYNGANTTGRISLGETGKVSHHTSARGGSRGVEGRADGYRGASLASVGRLHPVKNFDSLIRAMRFLPEEVGLTIWGDGAERVTLETLVEDLGLTERVRMPGESQTIREALIEADIYIQPSRSEGCSFAVAEAMLYGMPVVVTPCGGLPEQVEDGVTGLVAKDCTPEALAEAILPLVNDGELAGRLGLAAQAAAEEKYSMQTWLEETTRAMWDTSQTQTRGK